MCVSCRWRPGKGFPKPEPEHTGLGAAVLVLRCFSGGGMGGWHALGELMGTGMGLHLELVHWALTQSWGAAWPAAPTPTRRAARRPPTRARACPPHPAAGGQCCYEEKAPIVRTANRHTPDLSYCASSIQMQTSRVRRPQSARPLHPAPPLGRRRPATPDRGQGGGLHRPARPEGPGVCSAGVTHSLRAAVSAAGTVPSAKEKCKLALRVFKL